jgi:UDP-N-acetylglucosamine--N-acetylmuramyl-(pentapeptide) pyrophosphoryl-undecaprenol N-acetylglucosamine transferase
MRLLIVAGGGGHFSPVLAIYNDLPKEWSKLVVGRKYAFEGDNALSLEYQTAKKLKIPFVTLKTGRLQRRLSRHTITSLFQVPKGVWDALDIVKKFRPDVVISFGGYISIPVAVAASILRIPIVIHEQTFGAGLANAIVGKMAKKICISWKTSEKYFPPAKTILTGNPLRKEFTESKSIVTHIKKTKPVLYITGGSAGAHGINILIEGCLKELLQKYIVIHQTGDAGEFKDYDRLIALNMTFPVDLQKRYKAFKFIDPDKVVSFMNEADLVISRSGINSVTELIYLGKPCLLLPLPYGQLNEQLTNAKFVQKLGLALIEDQIALTPAELLEKIEYMISHLERFTQHSLIAKKSINVTASEKIIEVIHDVYEAK